VYFKQFYLGCLAHASYLVNVVGGTSAWIAAGHEVEKEGADGCAVASPPSSSRS
jgi:hypothetical protein